MATGDPERDGWERSDFPIVCETCLGDNPYIRMTRAKYGAECKVCSRPFSVFRWKAGTKGRYKKTEICQMCAKAKNVCQCCILDLEFGLPVQVRDSAMPQGANSHLPVSKVNTEWWAKEQENRMTTTGATDYSRVNYHPMLQQLARTAPYYDRNQAKICSFFLKGTCTRGAECPYRHEQPEHKEQRSGNVEKSIKDRFHGSNDPVANKMLKNFSGNTALKNPQDTTIKSVYVGNVDERITENDLKDHFYVFGEINEIKLYPKQRCAFVSYKYREAAEAAVKRLYNSLIVNGCFLKVAWARPRQLSDIETGSTPMPLGTGPSKAKGPQAFYPSMNPENEGTIGDHNVQGWSGAAPGEKRKRQAEAETPEKKAKVETPKK